MNLIFDWCHLFKNDWDCKLGLDWYSFNPVIGSKLPGSKGIGIVFYAIWWRFSLTWVKDFAAYQKRMNYRHSDHIVSIKTKKAEK